MIGRTIGQYRVDARLGAGGMGVVYRAYDSRLQRPVALKVVTRRYVDADENSDILEEARAASGLNHPNICTVYEVADVEGEAFIAMEYVAGRPLAEIIPPGGLPYEDVLRYATDVAGALAHAHERGVIHRDLKSANVVIASEGRAKVLDFGIARRITVESGADTSSGRLDAQGAIPGTTAYIAPEVLRGDPADARSDIWALGVLMYEMSTGEMPFTGRNQFDLTSAIIRASPAPLPPHVPVALRGIIMRCLAKDPVQRYHRAGEVRAALEAIQSDVAVRMGPLPRRSRSWIVGVAIGGAAIAAGIAGWRLWPTSASLSDRLTKGGRLSPVLSSGLPTSDPSLSSDGKMVTFIAEDEQGRVDVYTMRVAGGARIRLTNDDDVEAAPRFSADGERIAFGVRALNTGSWEVRVVPSLGGDPVTVIPNAHSPAWSRDGRLVYLRKSNPDAEAEVTVSRSDGSESATILKSDSALPFLRNPAWAPDGEQIAIIRGSGGISGEIWIVQVSGQRPARRIGNDPAAVFADWPSFTPDGRYIVHASNRGGATNLWLVPIDASAPIRLTTGPGADEWPSLAADGSIAFLNSRWKNVLQVYPLPVGEPTVLASHTPYLWAPAFSPDGREIAFSRAEVDGSWHVWTVPAAGGTPRRLTNGTAGELYPRYTPDGRYIFFHTWNVPRRIGRVDRTGGAVQMLSFGNGTSDAFADVSPDGRTIVLTRTEADAERLYVAPATGGEARLLTRTPGAVGRWSADGKTIVFGATRGLAGILVIGADGQGERRLVAEGGWPAWWPGRGIAYMARAANGSQEIRVVNPAGGSAARLDHVKFFGTNYPFDISHRASSLATSNGVYVSAEIWLLEQRK